MLLRRALQRLINTAIVEPNPVHLATLARVAGDLGERRLAAMALIRLRRLLDTPQQAPQPGSWLAPASAAEMVPPPGVSWQAWLAMLADEALIRLGAYSSESAGPQHRPMLERIVAMPGHSLEMERRLQLLRWRSGETVPPPETLAEPGPGHRNAGLWRAWRTGERPLPEA